MIVLLLASAIGFARQSDDDTRDDKVRSNPAAFAGQFFDHDFVNVYLYGNGVYDTHVATLQGGQSQGSFGWDVGGGLTAMHEFREGLFSFSYRGGYRGYISSGYNKGTDQNLNLSLQKRLNRRWSVGITASGGILEYGSGFYSTIPAGGTSVLSNPLSPQTRFANVGLNFTFQQTRRLSYVFGGDFFLNEYNYAGAIGTIGGSGSVSLLYRVTPKTTLGGTYSRSYYSYSKSAGTTNIDSGSLTLTHAFPQHWRLDLSAGASRSHTKGVLTIPVSILLGQQLVTGYYTGPYDRTNITPSFQGLLTRSFRRSALSFSGGQGVISGNGTFLTSRNQFAGVTLSYSTRHSNFSLGGSYNRLTSLSTTVSQDYSSSGFSASYGHTLARYLSTNLRYDFLHYGGLFSYGEVNDSRFSFGLSLSSKSVPLTLF